MKLKIIDNYKNLIAVIDVNNYKEELKRLFDEQKLALPYRVTTEYVDFEKDGYSLYYPTKHACTWDLRYFCKGKFDTSVMVKSNFEVPDELHTGLDIDEKLNRFVYEELLNYIAEDLENLNVQYKYIKAEKKEKNKYLYQTSSPINKNIKPEAVEIPEELREV